MKKLLSTATLTLMLTSAITPSVFAESPSPSPATSQSPSQSPATSQSPSPSQSPTVSPSSSESPSTAPSEGPTVEPTSPTQPKEDVKVKVTDKTGTPSKEGIFVEIPYSEETGSAAYLPQFTFNLRTKDGKQISEVKADAKTYDQKKRSYLLNFPVKSYELGDEFQLLLSKTDNVAQSVVFYTKHFEGDNLVTDKMRLSVNQYYPLKIGSREVEVDESTTERILDPSKDYPARATVDTDNTKFGIYLVNDSGVPLKNQEVFIQLLGDKPKIKAKSDDYGVVLLDSKDLTDRFLLYAEGKQVKGGQLGKATLTFPYGYRADKQSTIITQKVTFENDPNESAVTVAVKINPTDKDKSKQISN